MSNEEDPVSNLIAGTLLGTLMGGMAGLGITTYLLDAPIFFTGDIVLLGAIVCGALGYLFGSKFIDWLWENWWWF